MKSRREKWHREDCRQCGYLSHSLASAPAHWGYTRNTFTPACPESARRTLEICSRQTSLHAPSVMYWMQIAFKGRQDG